MRLGATIPIWTTCLLNISLAACQTNHSLPDWQGVDELAGAEAPIARCEWPDVERESRDGQEYFVMDAVGFGQQLQCQATEQANYEVAAANAESVQALIDLVNTVDDIGRRQQDLAEFQLDELERDRREATIEGWTYKGLLAAVLIAIAL